jgi:hypothetical protein
MSFLSAIRPCGLVTQLPPPTTPGVIINPSHSSSTTNNNNTTNLFIPDITTCLNSWQNPKRPYAYRTPTRPNAASLEPSFRIKFSSPASLRINNNNNNMTSENEETIQMLRQAVERNPPPTNELIQTLNSSTSKSLPTRTFEFPWYRVFHQTLFNVTTTRLVHRPLVHVLAIVYSIPNVNLPSSSSSNNNNNNPIVDTILSDALVLSQATQHDMSTAASKIYLILNAPETQHHAIDARFSAILRASTTNDTVFFINTNNNLTNVVEDLVFDMIQRGILNAVERRIFQLNNLITNTRRGLRNSLSKWLLAPATTGTNTSSTTNSNNSGSGAGAGAGSDADVWLLGDLLFLTRDYESAAQTYALLHAEVIPGIFNMELGEVYEMTAMCYFMLKQPLAKIVDACEKAMECIRPNNGNTTTPTNNPPPEIVAKRTRKHTCISLLAVEAYATLNSPQTITTTTLTIAHSILKLVLKAHSPETDLGAAILIEQATQLYQALGWRRKAAFHLVMAGTLYKASGLTRHAFRAFADVFYSIFDHAKWDALSRFLQYQCGTTAMERDHAARFKSLALGTTMFTNVTDATNALNDLFNSLNGVQEIFDMSLPIIRNLDTVSLTKRKNQDICIRKMLPLGERSNLPHEFALIQAVVHYLKVSSANTILTVTTLSKLVDTARLGEELVVSLGLINPLDVPIIIKEAELIVVMDTSSTNSVVQSGSSSAAEAVRIIPLQQPFTVKSKDRPQRLVLSLIPLQEKFRVVGVKWKLNHCTTWFRTMFPIKGKLLTDTREQRIRRDRARDVRLVCDKILKESSFLQIQVVIPKEEELQQEHHHQNHPNNNTTSTNSILLEGTIYNRTIIFTNTSMKTSTTSSPWFISSSSSLNLDFIDFNQQQLCETPSSSSSSSSMSNNNNNQQQNPFVVVWRVSPVPILGPGESFQCRVRVRSNMEGPINISLLYDEDQLAYFTLDIPPSSSRIQTKAQVLNSSSSSSNQQDHLLHVIFDDLSNNAQVIGVGILSKSKLIQEWLPKTSYPWIGSCSMVFKLVDSSNNTTHNGISFASISSIEGKSNNESINVLFRGEQDGFLRANHAQQLTQERKMIRLEIERQRAVLEKAGELPVTIQDVRRLREKSGNNNNTPALTSGMSNTTTTSTTTMDEDFLSSDYIHVVVIWKCGIKLGTSYAARVKLLLLSANHNIPLVLGKNPQIVLNNNKISCTDGVLCMSVISNHCSVKLDESKGFISVPVIVEVSVSAKCTNGGITNGWLLAMDSVSMDTPTFWCGATKCPIGDLLPGESKIIKLEAGFINTGVYHFAGSLRVVYGNNSESVLEWNDIHRYVGVEKSSSLEVQQYQTTSPSSLRILNHDEIQNLTEQEQEQLKKDELPLHHKTTTIRKQDSIDIDELSRELNDELLVDGSNNMESTLTNTNMMIMSNVDSGMNNNNNDNVVLDDDDDDLLLAEADKITSS